MMVAIRHALNSHGIIAAPDLYNHAEIAALNAALDPHFASLSHKPRSYAYSTDLIDLGIVDAILTDRVLCALFEIIPDPILYHFHVYETAGGQDRPHIASDSLQGWHRDVDSAFDPAAPSHVSLFVYLSAVGEEDGGFEFMTDSARGGFVNGGASVSVRGSPGHAFFWNRYFYHRAAPNRGMRRRRVLKLSFQPNACYSRNLHTDYLSRLAAAMCERDEPRRLLFGAYAGGEAPRQELAPSGIAFAPVPPNAQARVSSLAVIKEQVKAAVRPLRRKRFQHELVANYD